MDRGLQAKGPCFGAIFYAANDAVEQALSKQGRYAAPLRHRQDLSLARWQHIHGAEKTGYPERLAPLCERLTRAWNIVALRSIFCRSCGSPRSYAGGT
jgi:hypothetical protein